VSSCNFTGQRTVYTVLSASEGTDERRTVVEAETTPRTQARADANARLVTEYLEAWSRMDIAAGSSFYADDVVVHVAGRHPLAGTYAGKDAFDVGYTQKATALTGGNWGVIDVEDILTSADRAVALVTKRFEREGRDPLETYVISIYKIEGEKIVKMWLYDHDPYAVDDYFRDAG
jgi:ketosteroid isomerase-like protein